MRVDLTAEARGDLERIGDYIAQDNPARARSFVRDLIAKARQIGDNPQGYVLVPRYENRNIRRLAFGNYLIFYRVEEDRISVIHVLHGARDYEALLFPDE